MSQIGGTGAPTPRRSTRVASKAGSIISQSNITAVTAGGTKQQRKGPLTKVKARKSNAYGASGRIGAAEELSISAAGFAQAFGTHRDDAIARDDALDAQQSDDDIDELGDSVPRVSGALNGNGHRRSPSPLDDVPSTVARGPSFLSQGIGASDDDLAASIVNTSKSFGLEHEAGMLNTPRDTLSLRIVSEDEPYTSPAWQKTSRRRIQAKQRAAVPDQDNEPTRPIPRATAGTLTTRAQQTTNLPVTMSSATKQPGIQIRQPQATPRFRSRLQEFIGPQAITNWLRNVEGGEQRERHDRLRNYLWVAFFTFIGAFILYFLAVSSGTNMSAATANVTVPQGSMYDAIATRYNHQRTRLIQWILPPREPEMTDAQQFKEFKDGNDDIMWSRMAKMSKQYDGRFGDIISSIDDLKTELPKYLVVREHPDGRREVTDEFWHALIAKAQTSNEDPKWVDFLKENELRLQSIFSVPRSVDGSLPRTEAASRNEVVKLIESRYKDLATTVDRRVAEAIKDQGATIKALVETETRRHVMDSIRLQSLAMSNLVANHDLNLKKPNYFSVGLGAIILPTLTSATYLDDSHFAARLTRKLALAPERKPPSAALTKWEEPGDCWCSAPNPPKTGQAQLAISLGRAMYPQQVTIEHLPMSMVPAGKIDSAPRDVELWVDADPHRPITTTYAHRANKCQAGPEGWACLGTFKYNIHASNHLQTFDLDAEPSFPVNRVLLRVTTNWGADHTCLYRVRLHGRDALLPHTYDVSLNDPVA